MTNPVTEILPRSGRTPDEVEMMTEFSLLIEEFVNFGTHVFKWEVEQARGGDENIPVQMMFRHILELADSVSILVKESSIDPCKLLLRGMLESVLGFEYLLEKDTHNRAMGFMVWHHHHKLKRYRMLNPKDKSSKDLSARLKADKVLLEGVPDPFIANLEERIQGLENLLSTPAYQLAESEYQKLLSKKIKGPKWHQLFWRAK
ncbi:MAG: hypothetical protein IPM81_14275 [Saprospirales bacterium]|nr:hypothetical protein [Saprospirales bacterium]